VSPGSKQCTTLLNIAFFFKAVRYGCGFFLNKNVIAKKRWTNLYEMNSNNIIEDKYITTPISVSLAQSVSRDTAVNKMEAFKPLVIYLLFHLAFAAKNVLFFAVDDLRPELTCYEGADFPSPVHPKMHTPNIDALAAKSLLLSIHFELFPFSERAWTGDTCVP